MLVKREKDRRAGQQGGQKYPPMNPLEFDDWLFHPYLHPLDNFVDAATWRGLGRLFRIAAAKSEYGL